MRLDERIDSLLREELAERKRQGGFGPSFSTIKCDICGTTKKLMVKRGTYTRRGEELGSYNGIPILGPAQTYGWTRYRCRLCIGAVTAMFLVASLLGGGMIWLASSSFELRAIGVMIAIGGLTVALAGLDRWKPVRAH